MVGTIGFAGSKAKTRGTTGRWWVRIGGVHLLSSILGGLTLGALVAFAGAVAWSVFGQVPIEAAVFFFVGLVAADAVGLHANYLSRARQVPLSWKHVFPAPMSAALYGMTLGFGLGTTIYFWSFHALLLLLFLDGDLKVGLVAGASFGVGRALLPTLSGLLLEGDDPPTQVVQRLGSFLHDKSLLVRTFSSILACVLAWAFMASR